MKTIRLIQPLFHQLLKRQFEASNVFIKSDLEDGGARKIDLYKNETSDSAFSLDVLISLLN